MLWTACVLTNPPPPPRGEDTIGESLGGDGVLTGLGELSHLLPSVSGHSDKVTQEADAQQTSGLMVLT